MEDYRWSKDEKKKARKIFDDALRREYDLVIKKVRELANTAASPPDIWEIHSYLQDTLKTMNRKYDYRYSQIIHVFGELLAEGLIPGSDLEDLSADKVEAIEKSADSIKRWIMKPLQ